MPARRACLLRWARGQLRRGGVGLPVGVRPGDAHLVAGVVLAHGVGQGVGRADGPAAESRDDVTLRQASLLGRAVGHHSGHRGPGGRRGAPARVARVARVAEDAAEATTR